MSNIPDLGHKSRKSSADLTVETLPTGDGAVIRGSSLEKNKGNPQYGFLLVNGQWYGLTDRKAYSPEEVVVRAKKHQYDWIYDGLRG